MYDPSFNLRPVVPDPPPSSRPSGLMRLWLRTPDWVFRVAGALFFLAYAASRMGEYRDFPNCGPWFAERLGVDAENVMQYGPRHYFPAAKVLVDLTFLLIALSFCIRVPPRRRADSPGRIVIPLIGGFWPLLPFMALSVLKWSGSPLHAGLDRMLGLGEITPARFYAAMMLMSAGNLLDVWGYSTLLRSLSIVAEARALKVGGPYRFVRHPIYLGQFLAQAGHWLVLIALHWVWVVFYAVFVAMQLYRARVEEGVLEEAFGDDYRRYKARTFWFL